ncbi:hypothetical protein A4U53_030905 [Rhizobium ruizarguesonis]|uniref:Uncharacterized protein n=2 Tax=Rhizobium TaxID=379 RepID=A0A179BTX9_RHILE|nr:hypothetical protein [Rhizobium leguminosarum]OAP95116.1 hypothetical protein A4U53_18005 [Rhizobium leguminosarum]
MAFVLDDTGAKIEIHHNTKGAINEHVATAWLMKQGYDVFRNASPRGRADLVANNWDGSGWVPIDVKSEGFDLDGFAPMNEGQRDQAKRYEGDDLKYLVVMDNGNCVWWNDIAKANRQEVVEMHWFDPTTGQRFLHPRNDMSRNEWSFFGHWMIKHHKDKLTVSQIDFLYGVAIKPVNKGGALLKREKEMLRKIHRFIYRKITGMDPNTGLAVSANDNTPKQEAA